MKPVRHYVDFLQDLEVSAQVLWNLVKEYPLIMCFMPYLSEKQIISKDYLVYVINTVYPDSMKKLYKALKDRKKQKR